MNRFLLVDQYPNDSDTAIQPCLADEADRAAGQGFSERREHGPVMDRLWRRDRGVGIAHGGRRDTAAFEHDVGLHTKKGGIPQYQIGQLTDLDLADMIRDTVRDGRVYGVFGKVTPDAEIIVIASLLGQAAALALHLVGGLPGPDDDLTNPAHGLAV